MTRPVAARRLAAAAAATALLTSSILGGREVGTGAPWSSGPQELRFTGTLTPADYERLFERTFDVPPGTRRIEVEYAVTGAAERTVVDLGLRSPSGMRGWSGGSRSRVWVSALGATPGYLPGPIEPGTWAVVVGVPNIRPGRSDTYTIAIRLFDTDLPPGPVLGGRGEGWYVGDLHVHSAHSDGRSPSRRGAVIGTPAHLVFEAARAAGLDFLALTDHNTASHWLDVDRLQPYYDDLLLLHGREVTTYRGHAVTAGERAFHEFRLASPAASPAAILGPIAAAGAFVSINHPTAPDDERCMGCGWNDTGDATMAAVHGIEVVNGDAADGPLAGWPFWAAQLSRGRRLTAVGGSDEHTIAESIDRAIGRPATVVWARELSEAAIVEGLKSGRVHVRTRGPGGPLLDIHAEHRAGTTLMGRVASEVPLRLVATVRQAAGQRLEWIADGRVVTTQPVDVGPLVLDAPPAAQWYAAVLRDDAGPTAFSNAIYRVR